MKLLILATAILKLFALEAVADPSAATGPWAVRSPLGTTLPGTQWEDLKSSDPLMLRFRHEVVAPLEKQFRWARYWVMEYESTRTKTLLPGCRAFVLLDGPTSHSGPYVYTQDGTCHNLQGGQWTYRDGQSTSSLPEFSDFFASQNLRLASEADALELAPLIEELSGTATWLGAVRDNTRNFTLYNAEYFRWLDGPFSHWKWIALREGNTWFVSRTYIGPPASIFIPPVWMLHAADDRLIGVQLSVGKNPLGQHTRKISSK